LPKSDFGISLSALTLNSNFPNFELASGFLNLMDRNLAVIEIGHKACFAGDASD
jgi:hypothetical protein